MRCGIFYLHLVMTKIESDDIKRNTHEKNKNIKKPKKKTSVKSNSFQPHGSTIHS